MKVPEEFRIRLGAMATSRSDGPNGAFAITSPIPGRQLWVIASDGAGWEHVSVSVRSKRIRTPTWREMCYVKDLFWDEGEAVMQLHPRRSDYVNFHEGCLHMWRPSSGSEIPLPPSMLVGPRDGNCSRCQLYKQLLEVDVDVAVCLECLEKERPR